LCASISKTSPTGKKVLARIVGKFLDGCWSGRVIVSFLITYPNIHIELAERSERERARSERRPTCVFVGTKERERDARPPNHPSSLSEPSLGDGVDAEAAAAVVAPPRRGCRPFLLLPLHHRTVEEECFLSSSSRDRVLGGGRLRRLCTAADVTVVAAVSNCGLSTAQHRCPSSRG
jgi:hypothetical protein